MDSGVGWNIYLYLNRDDVHALIGLGYTLAAAAICTMLIETVIGSVICAGLAWVIWEVINAAEYTRKEAEQRGVNTQRRP